MGLLPLPPDLLSHAFGFAPLLDVFRCRRVSIAFRNAARSVCSRTDSLRQDALEGVPKGADALSALLCSLQLVEIKFQGAWCNDEVLSVIADRCHALRVLHFQSSTCTDAGVGSLTCLNDLRSVDMTFSNQISYRSVLTLYDHCPEIREVRRQPAWLDGHFACPWGETHTYYCDGAFQFDRATESAGWVCKLYDHGHYLEDRLQYVDAPWLLQYKHVAIGVLLKRGEPRICEGSGECVDNVLVVQAQQGVGMEVPDSFPSPSVCDGVEVGKTQEVDGGDMQLMVSRIRIQPIHHDTFRPPLELQTRIRQFIDFGLALADH